MKSADARLQATGIFQTTAIRISARTSESCGWAVSGSQKKTSRSIFAPGDLGPDLLIAAQRAALQFIDGHAQGLFQQFAGGPRRVQFMLD